MSSTRIRRRAPWRVVAVCASTLLFASPPLSLATAAAADNAPRWRAPADAPADSSPALTMPLLRRLASARRAIDSIARTHPLASSRIPVRDLPVSVAGQITLGVAQLHAMPAFAEAVRHNDFPSVAAYVRARAWLDAAWALLIAQRAGDRTATIAAVPGMRDDLLAFVRAHERDIAALGFPKPPPFVASDVALHDYFAQAPYVRHFYDSSAHTLAIMTTSVSDYLQGFIDSADAPAPVAAGAPPLRVLFIGNSLTYYHAMPRIFAQLAAAGLHRRVVAGVVSLPGSWLPQLWAGTDVETVLQRLPWDVVVVQVRPGGTDVVQTNQRYARMIAQRVRAGGRVFVWGPYLAPGDDPVALASIDAEVGDIARVAPAAVSPVPAVWDAVRQADTAAWRRLFDDLPHDDTHPSASGSYLLALAFYRSIAGHSPVGLPLAAGAVSLSPEDARLLQRAVASVRF